jgi:hypothetical protein
MPLANHPPVYSLRWRLSCASICLHAARQCAAEQMQVRHFWSNSVRLYCTRRPLTRAIAAEKRRRARAAFAHTLVALVLLRTTRICPAA